MTKKHNSDYKNKSKKCYLLDDKGFYLSDFTELELQMMSIQYFRISCVLDNKLNFSNNILLTNIMASTDLKYKQRYDIMSKVDKEKMKYIITEDIEGSSDKFVILFKDKHRQEALIASFLTYFSNKDDSIHWTHYVINKLMGYPENINRGFFINQYIYRYPPKKLHKKFEEIDLSENMTFREKYHKKYDLVKKYDNFKEFNKIYNNIKKIGNDFIRDSKKDKNFQKELKHIKIHDYKLSKFVNKQNPMFKKLKPLI